ncbi:hypothetical protein Cst_c15350 [Thermoclostridium stercorarium subsp. stercorarium DSM 8532]|uniref:DUF58 domain-containing protein n=2 Tax=Thermoclostridium stercorarium TaxID=1510 RepID=L7VP15_THES1|nr:DUF58 domain-containing protein [Thermoclostridium stercorarium]AGC68522.1 hypothetical protein Cst_c15350 [Thermoclostridium stercorarium subsp. stercorarium DSM 8532]AGI39538.1 hypothetical protein Clst_1482 [Thermoclostridium stercorarium subsp. stercorarium DSM 8532]ANX01404.1 hypothetical protein CSTERLE_07395 [Thermoclostridium stercorarium subsp. leptospartum DSM 9219]
MKILTNEDLRKLQSLSLQINLPVSGQATGNRKSRNKGISAEFSDYREYTPGDDFRRIDWNAYGRFNRLFVKLYMEEREAPVRIFTDVSLSMDYGSPSKFAAALRLAAAISYISLLSYDSVYICPWNEKVLGTYGPFRNQAAYIEVDSLLSGLKASGKSNLYNALRSMEWKPGRGISIVITDGLLQGGLEEGLKYLKYKNQDVFLCLILSPDEMSPSVNGAVELIDSETGERMEITVSDVLIKKYEEAMKRHLAKIREQCRKLGIQHTVLTADMPVDLMLKNSVIRNL